MNVTSDPATCDCRRIPWVTIAMLGGVRHTRDDGTRVVECPDHTHCLRGAAVRDGRITAHYRNLDTPCKWVGHWARESMPCECGGWPWVRADTLPIVTYMDMIPTSPIRSATCPGCHRWVDAEHNRFTSHTRSAGEPCVWSGIYIAVGDSVPPLPAPPPVCEMAP